jgi:phosphatidylglycerophosphate synthase/putative flippase GtrA
VVIAFGAALAVAGGRFALGGWLFLSAGLLDFLDGRVARATDTATRRGAVVDSVVDRYVEASFLIGLAWYYRGDWVLLPGLLALSGSLLVPYVRARGEALNVKVDDVGFMQRTERVVLLGLGTALSPVVDVLLAPRAAPPRHYLAIGALLLLAVTSHVSALQRLRRVLLALGGQPLHADRLRPLKSVVANALATGVDFVLANALYFGLGMHGVAATVLGCVAGALVSFTLSRAWAFEARGGSLWLGLNRYAVASAATAALNGGGVALLLLVNVPFVVSWLLARAVVFVGWSYPVQRDFVFVTGARSKGQSPVRPPAAFTVGGTPRASAGAPH